MGLLTKRVCKILAVVLAAVMLIGIVCIASAEAGNLPRGLLIALTAASGATSVLAARKGWKP